MAGQGKAFVKGGCGCLGAFLVVGILFVLIGGSMRLDFCSAACLFAVGGVIGLIVWAIRNSGYRAGYDDRLKGFRKDIDD